MNDKELSPEAPVTGQARMDVAWGANTGDETVSYTHLTLPTTVSV